MCKCRPNPRTPQNRQLPNLWGIFLKPGSGISQVLRYCTILCRFDWRSGIGAARRLRRMSFTQSITTPLHHYTYQKILLWKSVLANQRSNVATIHIEQ